MQPFSWMAGRHGAVVVAGKRLEAVAYGPPPGSAPTIVMLHEGLGCVALWRDFPAKLAEATGWGVFAYSRAGYGASDPVDLPRPLDYMTLEARSSLPQILDAIWIPARHFAWPQRRRFHSDDLRGRAPRRPP